MSPPVSAIGSAVVAGVFISILRIECPRITTLSPRT